MNEPTKQFRAELDKLIRYYCVEADLTIADVFSTLQFAALDLRDLVTDRDNQEDGEPE